jgi:hypothetical protein
MIRDWCGEVGRGASLFGVVFFWQAPRNNNAADSDKHNLRRNIQDAYLLNLQGNNFLKIITP